MEKYIDKDKAIAKGKELSKDSEELYFVVLSHGYYYVDTDGFIRNWETLIGTFKHGKIIK
ncbi:MAG: hypothetical protein ACK5I7_08640 [Anaerotignum sp.]